MTRTVEVPEYEVHDEVRLDPSRTALVVVDMQNDFVKEGGTLVVPDAEGTIPVIRSLLGLARESGMKVVFSQDTHADGDPEWNIWPEHAREGSWGWRIVDELAPREDEPVIRKVRYDAFYGTHLDHFLRLWGVDTLVVCGTVANICVHYTAASAATPSPRTTWTSYGRSGESLPHESECLPHGEGFVPKIPNFRRFPIH